MSYGSRVSNGVSSKSLIHSVAGGFLKLYDFLFNRGAKYYDTVAAAVVDTSYFDGDKVRIKERGNGLFDVVLSSTVTENTYNIIQCTGVGTLSLELRLKSGVRYAAQFGASDGIADSFGPINACILTLTEGGKVYLPEGVLNIGANTIRDDVIGGPSLVGKTITLIGVGSNEDPVNSGRLTHIKTTGANDGIWFTGNRSGGKDFTIEGDNGALDSTVALVVSAASRAQWKNVITLKSRGDGFWFKYGNAASIENIACISNKGNGFNADGTGYRLPTVAGGFWIGTSYRIESAGTTDFTLIGAADNVVGTIFTATGAGTGTGWASRSVPNDLNAASIINIDTRANGGIGFRTGVNSGFANNCYQITTQGNGGVGMEFNGNYWNVFGFYGEANDSAGTNRGISFSSTAQGNYVRGYFENVGGTWEDLSVNQRNYIEGAKDAIAWLGAGLVRLGEFDAPAGYLEFSGEGDGTNRQITLEGTGGSQTLEIFSSGAGTLKLDPQDGILLEASTAPTLLNSWVNYGGSRKVAGYYKDVIGIVHLEGVIASGTTTSPTNIFTLPVGYRPTGGRVYFSTTSNGAHASGFIETTGLVYFESGSNVAFSLNGISFRTD